LLFVFACYNIPVRLNARVVNLEVNMLSEANVKVYSSLYFPIMVLDYETKSILYVNQAFAEFTGFTSRELTGIKPPFPFWPLDKQSFYTISLEERKGSSIEWFLLKKNGESVQVDSSIVLIPPYHSESFLFVALKDITEAKKIEAALKESEAFKSSLLNDAPNPIVVTGPDSAVIYVNTAMEELTGFTNVEIVGKKAPYPWWDKDFKSGPPTPASLASKQRLERLCKKKNGELFWFSTSIKTIRTDGKIQYYIANCLDITEHKKAETTLRESEAFSTSLLEHAPNPVMVVNPDSSIRYVNPAFEKITGYGRDEVLNVKTPYPWWPKETVEQYLKTPSLRTSEFGGQERQLIHKNGNTVWISLSVRVIRENGKAKYVISNWVDLTQRKKAEEALKESEAFKSSLLDDAPNPIFVSDGENCIIYVNPAMTTLTGFSNAELIGKSPPYPWWPEERIKQYGLESPELRAGIISSIERMSRKKNGEIFWVSLSVRNIEKNENIIYSITNWVDITARKKMDEELKESEAFNSSLLNEAPNPVVVFNPDGTIKYTNPALERLTGFQNSELIGISIPHPWWPYEKYSEYRRESVIGTKKTVTMKERYFCKKNGEPFWVAVSMRNIMEGEKLKYTLSNWVDITDLKKMEKKISELYDQEKKQRKELEEEAKARGLFLNVLAHELRAPLTPITVSTSMLRDLLQSRDEEILKRLAYNIYDSTEKLSLRLEELLDLARYDRGTFRLNLKEVDLHSFLEGVITRFEPGLKKRRQSLTASIAEGLPRAELDPSRMEQVIINLLSNAGKYSGEGSEILFKANLENKQLLVEVLDHGVGISPENQKLLFRPYHRVEQDRRQFPGLGLGLAVSKQIIDAHGGKIWVTSRLGQGSSFFFSIPLK